VIALEDSLASIRRMGVMDYTNEAAIWSEEYAKSYATLNNQKAALSVIEASDENRWRDTAIIQTRARIEGAAATLAATGKKLGLLAKLGGPSVALTEQLTTERKELSTLNQQLQRLRIDAANGISGKFIINKASVPEKKSYPIRWLIVLLISFGSFISAFILLLFINRMQRIQI
jgi:uncharacterized protein involved in exopolysaccharide biosynthesis